MTITQETGHRSIDTPENRERVRRLREEGHSWRSVGEILGVTGSRCHQLWGAEMPSHRRTLENNVRPQVMEYLQAHGPVPRRQIGEKFGLTDNQVGRLNLPKHLVLASSARNDRTVYSDEDLYDALRAAAIAQGEPLTAKKYLVWRRSNPDRPSLAGLHRRGDWSVLCAEAGVRPGRTRRKKYTRNHTDDEMLAALAEYIDVCAANGWSVTYQRYEEEQRSRPHWSSGSSIRIQLDMRWQEAILAATEYARRVA